MSDSTIDSCQNCVTSDPRLRSHNNTNSCSQGLREYIEQQEFKKSRHTQHRINNPTNSTNLSIYDNLNELNEYLNSKTTKHIVRNEKAYFSNDQVSDGFDMESMLLSSQNVNDGGSKYFLGLYI